MCSIAKLTFALFLPSVNYGPEEAKDLATRCKKVARGTQSRKPIGRGRYIVGSARLHRLQSFLRGGA